MRLVHYYSQTSRSNSTQTKSIPLFSSQTPYSQGGTQISILCSLTFCPLLLISRAQFFPLFISHLQTLIVRAIELPRCCPCSALAPNFDSPIPNFRVIRNHRKAKMSGLPRSSSAPLKNGLPPQELLDDLCSRFVLNVPKEDLQSFERILFLVEYAHWFYEDNSVERNPSLKSFNLKEFTCLLFNSCDVLKPYVAHIDDIFKDFTSYKVKVPVTGAIILDETYERCILVKGWKGSSWSFPRGKKNKDEEDHACAIREVLEETGFDVTKLLNIDDYIEVIFGQQRVRLYIVAGVREDTAFAPLTKKEISEIAWHRLDDLQPASDDVISRGITGLKLYMVSPFLASLKSWIFKNQPPNASRPDMPLRGLSVWRAKNSSVGSSNMIMESQSTKPESDVHFPDNRPGKSFRNFRFNTAPILQQLEAGFSA